MILYHLQGHLGFEDFSAAVDRFTGGGNEFVLTLDGKSSLSHHEKSLIVERLNPLALMHDFPITWVSSSQIDSMLEAIELGLARSDRWEFYVNVSTTDIPLKSQDEILAGLRAYRDRDGVSGHVYLHKTIEMDPVTWREGHVGAVDMSLRWDTRFVVSEQIAHRFRTWASSPLLDVESRCSLHATEVGEARLIYIRPLFKSEARARQDFFLQFPYRIGRIWICLARNICEELVRRSATYRVREMLKSTMVPDESFFQSLLFSSAFEDFRIHPFNLHHGLGEPIDIRDRHLDELKTSQAYFARKFVAQKAPQVAAWLEEQRQTVNA